MGGRGSLGALSPFIVSEKGGSSGEGRKAGDSSPKEGEGELHEQRSSASEKPAIIRGR